MGLNGPSYKNVDENGGEDYRSLVQELSEVKSFNM